nr:MAG TPA: hypothetical protein [Caudoviricetes sp.]
MHAKQFRKAARRTRKRTGLRLIYKKSESIPHTSHIYVDNLLKTFYQAS